MHNVPALVWCLLSSLLLWLAYFPVNWGPLGWVALIPMLVVLKKYVGHAVRAEANGKWFNRPLLSAWLGGLAFCLVAFQWIRLASAPMYATWFVLALVVSLQWLFFFLFARLLHQTVKLPLLVAAPIVWTALESIRSQIWIGFEWYYLAHTQHEETAFTQGADLFGVYGLSFVMVMVNVALWRTVTERTLRVITCELVPAVALVGLLGWYGTRIIQDDAQQLNQPITPRIAVLQGNQPQDLRNDPDMWKTIDPKYKELGDAAAKHHPALIIAPETCLSFPWIRLRDEQFPAGGTEKLQDAINKCRAWIYQQATAWKADLLFGFNTLDFSVQPFRHTNSALLFDQQGRERGCYDKIVCLPFGEYIPWAETLPFMKWLSPYDYEYTIKPGTKINTLTWGQYRIAPLICYEDTVHDLTRDFMLLESPHFFINLSNDGWFKGSEEHEQHLVCARFRCIETRRSMVRAVNMGVSCIIDGLGRIVALPEGCNTWRDAKNHEGILIGSVPLYRQSSLYVRWGDVLPWTCWGVLALTLGISFFRRPRANVATA